MNNIDITFVVQGAISISNSTNITQKNIDSIRDNFPGSNIILSTWACPALSSLKNYDKLIVNDDPGQILTKNKYLANFNRMVKSTHSGLQEVETAFAAKVRSDFWFTHTIDFDKIYQRFPSLPDKFTSKLEHRILMCMYRGHYPLFPYFISDWFHFGCTKDLLKLWNNNFISDFVETEKDPKPFWSRPFNDCDATDFMDHSFHSEQELCFSFLDAIGVKARYSKFSYFKLSDLLSSYDTLSDLFIVESRSKLGLKSFKHSTPSHKFDIEIWESCIRSKESILSKARYFGYLAYLYSRRLYSIVKTL